MTPHWGFIVAAFAVAGAVVAGMVASILWDYRDLQSRLARLERRQDPRPNQDIRANNER